MRTARISRRASRDLDETWCWIARDSPEVAGRFVDEIIDRFPILAAYPRLGHPRPDLGPDILSFPFRNYVIYYRETRRGIGIVRVLHGARDAKAAFP
jgi:toxin ParE1/3/4